jgi:hypothetical protein
MVRPEGLGKLKKNPMISWGLELAIFRLVVWRLNHLRYRTHIKNTLGS